MTAPLRPICLPPAPLNGGPLDTAPPKVGDWIWQPKVDDRRVVIHAPSRTVWNQYGRLSVAMRDHEKFTAALHQLSQDAALRGIEWLDAALMEYRNNMMRGCIVLFDWITEEPFMRRRAALRDLAPVLPPDVSRLLKETGGQVRDSIYLISQWDNGIAPLKLYEWLKQENALIGHKFYEGLVAKRLDGPYPMSQRPKTETPHWVKHRFDQ